MDGKLIVTAGKSRSGKTLLTRQETASAKRLLVWDPKGAWARLDNCRRLSTRRELLTATRGQRGNSRLAFVTPQRADFDFFCQVAYWWGRLSPAVVVCEETGNVTHAGKASAGWHLLLSQGLEYGITIHAITQRPAESDKTAMGNASIIRTFGCAREADRRYIASELDITPAEVAMLEPLEYWTRDLAGGAAERRRIKPPQSPP